MASSTATREARVALGKCGACLRRRADPGHATCSQCRAGLNDYGAKRYAERRASGTCYRCDAPATGYLCDDHTEQRRDARAAANSGRPKGTRRRR